MKKFLSILMVFIVAVSMAACGQKNSEPTPAKPSTPAEAEAKAITMRIAHTLAPDSHYNKGLQKFAEIVDQKTEGKIKVELFHSSQLGSERDAIEGISMGTLEATLSSTGPLANFSKKFMVFDLPFIINDRETAFAAMDGEMGKNILASLDSKGIKGLGFWENGFRMITNSKVAINTPADVAGLKIRLMENPVHMETFKVLGAQPVPMPFGELFTALQQKTVDGQENPLVIIDTSKFYEVQNNLALTGHFYSPAVFMVSQSFYNKLTPELQKALAEAEKEARDWQRDYCVKMEKDLVEKLKQNGMTITTPDKKAFQEATKPVYDKFKAEIGEDVINALMNK
ncbi:TRAP transporter substrate-binding protein [Petroclostridium sp. X23]|uniref:TRAP transporter substrate-binding protein n=1 Tax=Petroclostridium sp. X23 TaxID=3045146 RepID=UPI0024AE487F|nr:TRAP transporter substrate-binding protein [Petroclostridium sp. X23]WHH61569.1 TRAP transporter substrate-binding protein [Petroclostridium sp. X23]